MDEDLYQSTISRGMDEDLYAMISWRDGLERAPDGALARQVPQPFTWSSSVWVTSEGAAYRRYYNPVDRSHAWEPLELAEEPYSGRLGYHIPAWTSIEQIIASAWRARVPGSRAHARLIDPRQPPTSDNVAWGEEERNEPLVDTHETWAPLSWTIGPAVCDSRYQISSRGRLRSPYTNEATAGFAAHGVRWAAVREMGLVNLTAAAGLVARCITLPPRLMNAYRALQARLTPPEYATCADIPEKRAWTYTSQVVPFVRHAKELVASDVRRVLEAMRHDPILGGPLTPLYDKVAPMMLRDLSMEELRFARTACVS